MSDMSLIEQLVSQELRSQAERAVAPPDAWDRFVELIDLPGSRMVDGVSGLSDVDGAGGDLNRDGDFEVMDLSYRVEIEGPLRSGRSKWMVGAVAATVLVVVAMLVVTDGNNRIDVTDPVSAPTTAAVSPPEVTQPVSSPEVTEPAQPLSTVDSLGFRWSQLPHDDAVFGVDSFDFDPAMTSVTAGGPGLVAVGTDGTHYESEGHLGEFGDAAVWTSVDGITWSRVRHDEQVFAGALMNGVTIGGPGLVAIGETESGAVVWTSVDGLTWSRDPLAEEMFRGAEINSVTAGGPGLVAVGSFAEDAEDSFSSAVVWTSVDGLTWSRVPLAEEMFRGAEITSVTAGGPGLVAVGSFAEDAEGSFSEAAVWTSVDGLAWSHVPHNEAMFGADAEQTMTSVIVGGPGLVAVGWFAEESDDVFSEGPAVWTSVDGLTWSRVAFDRAVWGYGNVTSLVSVDSGLVAVGADYRPWLADRGGRVWTSPDGITWSRAPHKAFFHFSTMASVTVGGPGLVAVGDTFSSDSDAVVWTATLEN